MSVEKVPRTNGDVWRVRWRDAQGRPRSRVIGRKRDAQALDADLKRAKRLGATAPVENSRETLSEFAKVWWNRHAVPNLQRHTLEGYASALDVHIIPRLGDVQLRSLTPELIGELRAELAAAASTTPPPARHSSCSRASSSALSNGAGSTPTRLVRSGSRANGGRVSCARSCRRQSKRCAPT